MKTCETGSSSIAKELERVAKEIGRVRAVIAGPEFTKMPTKKKRDLALLVCDNSAKLLGLMITLGKTVNKQDEIAPL